MQEHYRKQCSSHTLLLVMFNLNENFENCFWDVTIHDISLFEPFGSSEFIGNVASAYNFDHFYLIVDLP